MNKLTRPDILRKCIVVMEGYRRINSKGDAGLEATAGNGEDYHMSDEIVSGLKEWLREIEAGGIREETDSRRPDIDNRILTMPNTGKLKDWQRETAAGPLKELTI